MGTIEKNVRRMEAQLADWGLKLDDLVARAGRSDTDVTAVYYRALIDDLLAKHEKAQRKVEELRAAGTDNWDTLKDGVLGAWDELETAFDALNR